MSRIFDRHCAVLAALSVGIFARYGYAADHPSASSPSVTLDQQISEGSRQVAALEKLVREAPTDEEAASQCRSTFTVEGLLRAAASGIHLDDGSAKDLVLHQSCIAVLLSYPEPCAGLPGTKANAECKRIYRDMTRSKILLTAATDPAGARRICMRLSSQIEYPRSASDAWKAVDPRAFCDISVRDAADPHAWMLEMAALTKRSPGALSDAEEGERRYMGIEDDAGCSKTQDWTERRTCEIARIYRAAYVKRNPEVCGRDGLCRALMGQRTGCVGYAERLGEAYCAHRDTSGYRQRLVASLTKTQQGLMMLSMSINTIRSNEDLRRRQKIQALQKRCNRMLQELLSPEKNSKKNAKKKTRIDDGR